MNQAIKRCINRIEAAYNPERDVIADAPNVNWVDAYLLEIAREIIAIVEKREAEIDQLKAKVEALELRLVEAERDIRPDARD